MRKGQNLAELAIILTFVSLMVVGGYVAVGQQVKALYGKVHSKLSSVSLINTAPTPIPSTPPNLLKQALKGVNITNSVVGNAVAGIETTTVDGNKYGVYLRGNNPNGGYPWDFNPQILSGLNANQLEKLVNTGNLVVHFREIGQDGNADGNLYFNATNTGEANQILSSNTFPSAPLHK